MEYRKLTNFLDNARNQPAKFRTKNWVEIIDDLHALCNSNSHIKFKTSMLKPSLCDYIDAYVLVIGEITIVGAGGGTDAAKQTEIINK